MAVRASPVLAREDGGHDRLVAGLRDRAREARPGDDAQHLGDLDLDLRLGGDQPSRARGLCDRDVEARIGEPEGRELADRLLGRGCGLVDGAAIGLAGAFGCERRRLAEIARRQSVSSRSALRVGGSPSRTSAAGGSSRTNEPPVRPRRVSTKPASRRICSAWRRVIGATPSCAASSSSLGSRSPGASTPAPMASPRRRTICSTAPSAWSGASATSRAVDDLSLEHHYL